MLEESLLKKVILHDEKYLTSLTDVFLQKTTKFGEVIIYSVFLIICILVLSICFIKVDEVVKVQGVVKTETNISTIKNIVSGKILKINYHPGKKVCKDELLFKIDDENLLSELKTQSEYLTFYESELSVCNELLFLISNKNFERKNYSKEVLLKYETYLSTISKMQKEIEMIKNSYDDELSKPENLTSKRNVRDKKSNYEYLSLGLEEYKLKYKNEITEQIKSYEKLCLDLKNKIKNLEIEIEKTNVTSPVDGYVQEIQNFNEGDFIFSSQDVLKIVPSENNLFKAQLFLRTSDVGKVTEGLQVKLRFPAYPFYEYRGLTGKIENLDFDTTNLNTGSFYKLNCDFDKKFLEDKNGKNYDLRSGLEIDARIIVDRKTILKLLLKKLDLDL
jgi:multidrug resistance efflux pump